MVFIFFDEDGDQVSVIVVQVLNFDLLRVKYQEVLVVWVNKGVVQEGVDFFWRFCNLYFFDVDIVVMINRIWCFKGLVWVQQDGVMFKLR